MRQDRVARAGLFVVLAIFIVLGGVYSVVVPVFEKPDEPYHYFYVQHLLHERSLPIVGAPGERLWEQEGSQPPLYYSVAALAVSWIESSDSHDLLWLNPQRNLGDPGDPGNKNYLIHTEHEAWPYYGATLAIHVIRWLSLIMGAGTVLVTFLLVRQLFPARPLLALGAAAINAFVPQYLFIASSINNDSLVTFLAALVLLQLVNLLNRPERASWGRYLLLGVSLGLIVLTKLNGLVLVALTGLVFLWLAWKARLSGAWRQHLYGALIVGVVLIVLTGWWFVRNWLLYDDWTGIAAHLKALGGRRELSSVTLESMWKELIGLRASFWGLFGWFSILMPDWTYALFDVLTVAAAIGVIRWYVRGRDTARGAVTLLLAWFGLVFLALVRWSTIVEGSQGRLLFPALPAVALALALGWSSWLPARWDRHRGMVPLVAAIGLLILSIAVPGWLIAPSYALPAELELEDLPAEMPRVDVVFEDIILLYGCQAGAERSQPDETLGITCYWQALRPLTEDYYFYYHLLGRDLEPIGKEDGYPGSGSFPTSRWPTGMLVVDNQWLRLDMEAVAPTMGRIAVGVYHPDKGEYLTPVDPQGNILELVVSGRIKVSPQTAGKVAIPDPVHYVVGDLAILGGYQIDRSGTVPGGLLSVTLYWQPLTAPERDYTVLVQLLDDKGRQRGQGDGPPLNGDYPTSLWEPGETIADEHLVQVDDDLPAGRYQVAVGFYDPVDGVRLPIKDAAGEIQPDNRVLLPLEIRVTDR